MKLCEIEKQDALIYRINTLGKEDTSGILSKDYKSVMKDIHHVRQEYNKFKNVKSLRDKNSIRDIVGKLQNRVADIDSMCVDILNQTHDVDAIAIRNKLTPLYNELQQMYDSI